MAAEWKKYTHSKDERIEMLDAKHGFILRYKCGAESEILFHYDYCDDATHYLICEPLQHAEMRARHAMTGQPVWFKDKAIGDYWIVNANGSFYPDCEYTFTPPKKTIRFRNYLRRGSDFIHPDMTSYDLSNQHDFIEWIGDWQTVEINE